MNSFGFPDLSSVLDKVGGFMSGKEEKKGSYSETKQTEI
jgi:hypothetical protein